VAGSLEPDNRILSLKESDFDRSKRVLDVQDSETGAPAGDVGVSVRNDDMVGDPRKLMMRHELGTGLGETGHHEPETEDPKKSND
jgi:hypothetical protein